MNTGSFKIKGGDYQRAGMASSNLKKLLKKINVEPAIIRRAMIAAYEAEMNVVIHARNGNMRFFLDSDRIDMEVTDEGPGIPDIDLAMKEGYSTAPPEAKDLGFGAGMGLPNIKRNSDRFAIESKVGEGTTLNISIRLKPSDALETGLNSIAIVAGKCTGCFRCLHVCPTLALRVKSGGPEIIKHLCIDCAACVSACESGAISMAPAGEMPDPAEVSGLIAPPSLLAGLGLGVGPEMALKALGEMGFAKVFAMEAWEEALRNSVIEHARERNRAPTISPVCPAVVNLIEVRFPSLIENIAPFISPVEAARREFPEGRAAIVVSCPSQLTALGGGSSASLHAIAPETLREAILRFAAGDGNKVWEPIHESPLQSGAHDAQRAASSLDVLEISGMRHVMRILDKAENGLLGDVKVIELYACEGGCFGSPLLREVSALSRHRWQKSRNALGGAHLPEAKAVRRGVPFAARAGVRLDPDISRAIAKLSEMQKFLVRLPGKDCGVCGAPTCGALAEDIVMDRATISQCAYLSRD